MTKFVRHGFTLVELTIAIAFLSVLMMAILTLTISAGKLYIKGDTNKTINQAGRDFSDTIRRDLLSTGIDAISPYITVNAGSTTAPLESGRICLGNVSYLWNTASLLTDNSAAADAIKIKRGTSPDPIKFVRIVKPRQSYCDKNPAGKYPTNIPNTESATELLGGEGRDYAVHSLLFKLIARSGDRGIYQVSYTLGTNEPGTTERDEQGGYIRCKPDGNVASNFDYCSVNDFSMLVRIGGSQR